MNEYNVHVLLSEHAEILAKDYFLANRVVIFIHYMRNREQGGKRFQNSLSFDQFRTLIQEYSQRLGKEFEIAAAKGQIKSE